MEEDEELIRRTRQRMIELFQDIREEDDKKKVNNLEGGCETCSQRRDRQEIIHRMIGAIVITMALILR